MAVNHKVSCRLQEEEKLADKHRRGRATGNTLVFEVDLTEGPVRLGS